MFNARQMIAYFLFLLLYLFFLCIWGCLPLVCIANSTGWKLCRGLTFAQHQTILIRQSMEVMEVEIKSDCHWHKAGVYFVFGISFLSLWLQMVLPPSLMVFYLYGYKWWLKVRKSSPGMCFPEWRGGARN